MFKSKTVFVVGAGASQEVDMPIGKELTSIISKLLSFRADSGFVQSARPPVFAALQRKVNEDGDKWRDNTLVESARHIAEAMEMATSIDTFLESYADDEERKLLGKLGIAKAILDAERGSKLGAREENGRRSFRMKDVAATWYVSLAQLLFSGLPIRKVGLVFENVSFIVFNYDRCLEVFLIRALQIYFNLDAAKAEELVQNVFILHPYGSLGSVFSRSGAQVPFGAERCDLLRVADEINTFSESLVDDGTLATVRLLIDAAETIVFLGFGFHEQNMRVLSETVRKDHPKSVKRVLATVDGLSASDTKVVRDLIGRTLTGRPESRNDRYTLDTFNGKCAPFFAEYWRSLTA